MQFSYNSDYPGLTAANSTASPSFNNSICRDPEQFPPAEPISCARITTRVFHPSRNQVATVQNVLIRTMNCAIGKTRTNDMNPNTGNNNNASSTEWLNKSYSKFSDRFGGATRQQPPMNHAGVKHEQTEIGIIMSQFRLNIFIFY